MNKVEEVVDDQRDQQARQQAATALPGFLRLETGSLVTLRMQGHSRSPNGQEYYAPAVVLAQYADDYGSIDALVWDSSAGNHYAHGYHVRELGVRGEGATRETYELQTNVGQVLFSPDAFATVISRIEQLEYDMLNVLQAVSKMQVKSAAANEAMPSAVSSAPKGAEKTK